MIVCSLRCPGASWFHRLFFVCRFAAMMKRIWKCSNCSTINTKVSVRCKKCKLERCDEQQARTAVSNDTFKKAIYSDRVAPASVKRKLKKITDSVPSSYIGKRERAVMIARSSALSVAAEMELKDAYFSESTCRAYSSEVKLYELLMAESQIVPWPLHETSITRFASLLKVCKYRGANCYLTAISSTNKLMSHQLDFKAAYAMRMARIACDRDLGDDFSVDPITLSQLRDVGKLTSSRFRLLVGRLAVIGIYYCLRPRELLGLRGLCQCHSASCSCSAAVRLRCGELQITLYGDKTHQKNEKIVRSLVCCCGGSTAKWPIPTCPVCACKAIISSSSARSPRKFWLSQGWISTIRILCCFGFVFVHTAVPSFCFQS